MARELRLGFAMGGGVSLGSFSGAALSQALKLAIFYGYKEDKYDRIVADVFSGASAGAMSVAAMLRSLMSHDSTQEATALEHLNRDFGRDWKNGLSDNQQQELIAAQVMQDVQETIWCEEISMDRLLGRTDGRRRRIRNEAGLLDRQAVDQIAAKYMLPPSDPPMPRILGSRVLFACSLTNVSPIIQDARGKYPTAEAGYAGLTDGMRSFRHRELRVFDLHFASILNHSALKLSTGYPERWCRYHLASEQSGRVGNLMAARTWAKIAATAIACGAFPFAFAPVVLKRDGWEYGKSEWPGELGTPRDKHSYHFTYMDGGMLNNEPVREAFRLASYMDAVERDEQTRLVRRIIFVDPSVSEENPIVRQLDLHRQYMIEPPPRIGVSRTTVHRGTLDRLIGHIGPIFEVLRNESSVVESHGIYQTRKRFDLRDRLRKMLPAMLATEPDMRVLRELRCFCRKILKGDRENAMIPPGSLTIEGELRRIIREEGLLIDPSAWNQLEQADPAQRAEWLRALAFVAIDLVMDLEGKSEDAELVAIAPFYNLMRQPNGRRKETLTKEEIAPVRMPSGELRGFAGFMSPTAQLQAARAGRHCAHEFLWACGMIDKSPPRPAPAELSGEEIGPDVDSDVQKGLRALGDHAGQLLRGSRFSLFPMLDSWIKRIAGCLLNRRIRRLNETAGQGISFELRILVPDDRYRARSNDPEMLAPVLRPLRICLDRYCLILFAEFGSGDRWLEGPYIRRGRLEIEHRRSPFASIPLPSAHLVRDALHQPNPIFSLDLTRPEQDRSWEWSPGVGSLEKSLFTPKDE